MARKFPKRLFVKIGGDPGAEYFDAQDQPADLASTGETVKVGVYQLVELGEAEGTVNYRSTSKVR